jgi:hypothetical protein
MRVLGDEGDGMGCREGRMGRMEGMSPDLRFEGGRIDMMSISSGYSTEICKYKNYRTPPKREKTAN